MIAPIRDCKADRRPALDRSLSNTPTSYQLGERCVRVSQKSVVEMVAKFDESCFADCVGLYPGGRAVPNKTRQRNLHPPRPQRSPQRFPSWGQRVRVAAWRHGPHQAESLAQTEANIAPAAPRDADRARRYGAQPRREVTRIS